MIDVDDAVRRLIAARSGALLPLGALEPSDLDEVFAVQEATVAALGGCGGWKVGASSPTAAPTHSPLPRAGIRAEGAPWRSTAPWVAVEVEIALRVARPIDADLAERLDDRVALEEAFDAVMIAIEVVETRLDDWPATTPFAKAADLFSHGGLILGAAVPLRGVGLDFATAAVRLAVDGREVIERTGGNPAGDPLRLLAPLARHCAARRRPLSPGEIVTTGSCTGMLGIDTAADLTATIAGLGDLRLHVVPNPRRPALG